MADLPAWIFAALCLVGFLPFALYNGLIAWGRLVLSRPGGSYAPVIGGCLGAGAVLAAPLGAWTERLPYVVVPLLLDVGTLPYLALVARYLVRHRGPAAEMTLEDYRERQRSRRAEDDPAQG